MPFTDQLSKLSEQLLHAGLVAYFFLYYLVKGEKEEPEPIPCLDSKPTNVCCMHGTSDGGVHSHAQHNGAPAKSHIASGYVAAAAAASTEPVPKSSFADNYRHSTGPSPASSSAKAHPPPPPPPPPSSSQQKTPSSTRPSDDGSKKVDDFIGELRHKHEPEYPAALFGNGGSHISRTTVVVRSPGDASVPPPPPAIVGQNTVQIHVRPTGKGQTMIVGQPVEGERVAEVMWPPARPDDRRRDHSPAWVQRNPERSSLLRSQQTAEELFAELDEHLKPVAELRKIWPPPSNASGVEITKDFYVPLDGAPMSPSVEKAPAASGQHFEHFEMKRTRHVGDARVEQTSSYYSATEGNAEDELPKAFRNPAGDLQDIDKLTKEYGDIVANMMSPEKCHELSKQLLMSDATTSKGVELFSRRRERSDKWVIDETNVQKPPPPPPLLQQQAVNQQVADMIAAVNESPLVDKQETVLEQWRRTGGIKLVKSPWEAALENPDGDPSSAFQRTRLVESVHAAAAEVRTRPFSPLPRQTFDDHVERQTPLIGRSTPLFTAKPFSPPPPARFFSPSVDEVHADAVKPYAGRPPAVPASVHMAGRSSAVDALLRGDEKRNQFESPTPFSPPRSRTYTPAAEHDFMSNVERYSQFGVRELNQPRGWTTPTAGVTTGTIQVSTPSTHIVTSLSTSYSGHVPGLEPPGSAYSRASAGLNTLPRSWKSFSEAYRQD